MLTSEQVWNTPHYDIDGNRMTLLQLVKKDPEWAASRMAHERAELENLKAEIERLRAEYAQTLTTIATAISLTADIPNETAAALCRMCNRNLAALEEAPHA